MAEADVFGSDLSISSEEEAEAAKDEEVELWRPTLFNFEIVRYMDMSSTREECLVSLTATHHLALPAQGN